MTLNRLRMSRWMGALLSLSLLAVACGGDDDSPSVTASGDAPTATSEAAASTGSESCRPTPYLIAVRGTSDGEPGIDNEQFEVVSAKAVSLGGGAAYTIYLADFEIPDEEITMFSAPEPGEGQTLVTIFATIFNAEGSPSPIEAGAAIPYTPEFGELTFRVIVQSGEDVYSSYSEARGMLTVSDVGESFCGSIEYEATNDGFATIGHSLNGAFGAPVVKQF